MREPVGPIEPFAVERPVDRVVDRRVARFVNHASESVDVDVTVGVTDGPAVTDIPGSTAIGCQCVHATSFIPPTTESAVTMDEKTEELRDLFLDVAEEETVTEPQEETPGSLTDERSVDERLTAVIERMIENYDFDTDWSVEEYRRLVRDFFEDEGENEGSLAGAFDADEEEVFRARMDLHLLREEDAEFPFELRELRERFDGGDSPSDVADEFGVDEGTVRRARRVQRAREEARTANDRYRDEFEELVADGDLSNRLAHDAREDGLREATEGMENELEM